MHIHTGIAFAQRMQLAASRLEGETHSVESVTARLPLQFQGHRAQGMCDYADLPYSTICIQYTIIIYIYTQLSYNYSALI